MSEIERLKRRARKLYRRIEAELDTVDCGINMLCNIRPDVLRMLIEYDRSLDRLKEIDPEFPK